MSLDTPGKQHGFGLDRVLLALAMCVSAPAFGAITIAVDVGHYAADPGATSARGVPEFEYNRALALDIEQALRARSFSTMLVGAGGDMHDLYARTLKAGGADFFLSVHHDSIKARFHSQWEFEGVLRSYSDIVSGYSLFVSRGNPDIDKSVQCASVIGAALRNAGFQPSRYHANPVLGSGRAYADETNGVLYYDNLAVARTARSPAVLLEAGVIVNRDEELKLRDPRTRQRIAGAVADGLARCFAISPAQAR
jgi:N-acetylmuramoyl-L-alanine amidase